VLYQLTARDEQHAETSAMTAVSSYQASSARLMLSWSNIIVDHAISNIQSLRTSSFKSATCVMSFSLATTGHLAAFSLACFLVCAIEALLQMNQFTGGPTTISVRKLLGQPATFGICMRHHVCGDMKFKTSHHTASTSLIVQYHTCYHNRCAYPWSRKLHVSKQRSAKRDAL
jgi:hypothetical protein